MFSTAFQAVLCILTAALLAAGCAGVRQQDLDVWEGVSVEALDTHPLFLSMPVYRTLTSTGIEIRNYVNSEAVAQCFSSARHGHGSHVDHSVFASCSQSHVTCNNLFYIQAGKVIRYVPTGSCYTNESVRPQKVVSSSDRESLRMPTLGTALRA
ncbi:hypothetical protein [Variovorax sp. tm]|uniref:hypothetical protein n=1 Tax=Variovorax atrisoli TaxID=3394203 RepID=UPI003A7FEA5D